MPFADTKGKVGFTLNASEMLKVINKGLGGLYPVSGVKAYEIIPYRVRREQFFFLVTEIQEGSDDDNHPAT